MRAQLTVSSRPPLNHRDSHVNILSTDRARPVRLPWRCTPVSCGVVSCCGLGVERCQHRRTSFNPADVRYVFSVPTLDADNNPVAWGRSGRGHATPTALSSWESASASPRCRFWVCSVVSRRKANTAAKGTAPLGYTCARSERSTTKSRSAFLRAILRSCVACAVCGFCVSCGKALFSCENFAANGLRVLRITAFSACGKGCLPHGFAWG
jgi:hypothetical protein